MLVKEPFNYSLNEIRHLNPVQVRHIFFRPEEDDVHDEGDTLLSPRQLFWKIHHEWRGLSEEETEKLWQERCAQHQTPQPAQPQTQA